MQVGPAISLPIFDGGRLRAGLAERDANYDLAVAQYDQALVDALHEVAEQVITVQAIDTQIVTQQQALDAAQSAYDLGMQRFHGGLSGLLDVLTVQQVLLRSEQQIADLHAQRLAASIKLVQALGGGFQPDTGSLPTAAPDQMPSRHVDTSSSKPDAGTAVCALTPTHDSIRTSDMSDPNPSPAVPTAAAAKPARGRGAMLRILLLVLVLVAIGWVVWYFLIGRWHEDTDDAYVNGNVVQITPLVPGTVVSIGADDGSLVNQGQLLVQLDSTDAATALAQAEAALARTVRQVRGLYNGVDSSQAMLANRRADLDRARVDFARRQNLASTGAISAEELSHARDQLDSAQAAVDAASQKLATDTAMIDNSGVASQPDVQAAAAQVRQAFLNNARAQIVAPVTGYVARRSVQLGQRVQPGAALMAVVPLEQVWVDANFKETQLRQMRLGQPVALHADIYGGGIDYNGRIISLGIGTGSAFALLPAQNASGNWIKIVQRLPVRIALDPDEVRKHPLRIGLSMSADVDLRSEGGDLLPTQAVDKAVLSTDVYDHQLHEADALVAKIIAENLPAAAHASASGSAAAHSATNR